MDYLVCLFIIGVITFHTKILAFIFGVLALWAVSFYFERQRELISKFLPLFLLFSLISIAFHLKTDLIGIYPVNKYLNVYVMGSGIASIFMGVMLMRLVFEYHKTLLPYILISPIVLWNYSGVLSRMTIVMSVMLSIVVYRVIKRDWKWASFWLFACITVVGTHIPKIFNGVIPSRINGWHEAIKQIIQHPFIGRGFESYLTPMNLVYAERQKYGWVFIHNDFLALARCIGIVAPTLIFCFIVVWLYRLRKSPNLVVLGAVALTITFQANMFDVYKAMILIITGSLAIARGGEDDLYLPEQNG